MASSSIVSFANACIYNGKHLILKDVSFTVDYGEFVYVIGKVGSGKSSLVKTMNAELPLKRGQAMVLDYPLHKLRRKQIPYLRRKMGVVFQDFQLLTDRTVFDNLMFVLRATGWTSRMRPTMRIRDVLEQVHMAEMFNRMPHELSGGEQQRVVIARALLNQPALILADEPTGNLDPETSAEIMELLIEIKNGGQAVIMNTHNYSLLKKYPFRTLKLENGTVNEVQAIQEIDFNLLMEEEDFRSPVPHSGPMDEAFAALYPD